MTIMDVLGIAALACIIPPLALGAVALIFGDIIVAYADSRKEAKK